MFFAVTLSKNEINLSVAVVVATVIQSHKHTRKY